MVLRKSKHSSKEAGEFYIRDESSGWWDRGRAPRLLSTPPLKSNPVSQGTWGSCIWSPLCPPEFSATELTQAHPEGPMVWRRMGFNEKVMKTKTQCSDAPWKQSGGRPESWLGGGAQSTTSQGQPGVGAVGENQQGMENTEPAGILCMQGSLLVCCCCCLAWESLEAACGYFSPFLFSLGNPGNPHSFHTLRSLTLLY